MPGPKIIIVWVGHAIVGVPIEFQGSRLPAHKGMSGYFNDEYGITQFLGDGDVKDRGQVAVEEIECPFGCRAAT